jgi:hypothetical protein
MSILNAGMVELVDAPDSKSGASDGVRVRFSLPAPFVSSKKSDKVKKQRKIKLKHNMLFRQRSAKYGYSHCMNVYDYVYCCVDLPHLFETKVC